MSYANILLYGASLPSYKTGKDKTGKRGRHQEYINASDPRNRSRVKAFIDSID
ncbi:MAG: hypothetical protein ACI4AK_05925 [Lepagella sp.]